MFWKEAGIARPCRENVIASNKLVTLLESVHRKPLADKWFMLVLYGYQQYQTLVCWNSSLKYFQIILSEETGEIEFNYWWNYWWANGLVSKKRLVRYFIPHLDIRHFTPLHFCRHFHMLIAFVAHFWSLALIFLDLLQRSLKLFSNYSLRLHFNVDIYESPAKDSLLQFAIIFSMKVPNFQFTAHCISHLPCQISKVSTVECSFDRMVMFLIYNAFLLMILMGHSKLNFEERAQPNMTM